MMRVYATILFCMVSALLCSAQSHQNGDFFSGVVVAFSNTELTVSRKELGKNSAATKTFTIDEKTQIEGTLKAKAHVTVRFMPGENATRAVHIIVR